MFSSPQDNIKNIFSEFQQKVQLHLAIEFVRQPEITLSKAIQCLLHIEYVPNFPDTPFPQGIYMEWNKHPSNRRVIANEQKYTGANKNSICIVIWIFQHPNDPTKTANSTSQ